MITVSREILMHPDFTNNLANELCEMLEDFIDAEFEKGDDTDFDFIDECAQAINAIRLGDIMQVLPTLSRKDFLKKLGIKGERRAKIAVGVCAAVALLIIAGTQIEVGKDISIAEVFSSFISELFGESRQLELTTSQPETTAESETRETAVIVDICVETTSEFKYEYYVGEKFSPNGLKLFVEYSNGTRSPVPAGEFIVEAAEDFGAQPKYETVTVRSNGFEKDIEVRVIENLSTKKLNSIYAVFAENYSFTQKDLSGIDLSEMQVYAVYSDGSERELTAEEYTVETEYEKNLFDENVTVTVNYRDCSCSFRVYKE